MVWSRFLPPGGVEAHSLKSTFWPKRNFAKAFFSKSICFCTLLLWWQHLNLTRKKCLLKHSEQRNGVMKRWATLRRAFLHWAVSSISPPASSFAKSRAFICLNNSSQWPETLPLPLHQTVAAIAPTKHNKEYNNKEENNNNNDSGENYNKCYINYTYNIKTGQFLI